MGQGAYQRGLRSEGLVKTAATRFSVLRRQYLRRRVLVPAISTFIFGYFTYHAIQGERGVIALNRLKDEVAAAERVLADVRAQRIELENRTNRLSPQMMDLDLLDEQLRRKLGYAREDELIIYERPGSAE